MPKFGKKSQANLDQCTEDLRLLFNEVVKHYDCSVICGHRDKDDQDEAFHTGKSKLKFPESKHNSFPSEAVDVVPYFSKSPHIRWGDKEKFYEFAGFVKGIAASMGISVRWGGNWDSDDELHDQSFMDFPHFEINVSRVKLPVTPIVKTKVDLTKALNVIKSFEGILDGDPSTVNLDPYLCPANYWTIGWGHVVLKANGKQVKGKAGKSIAYSIYPGGITMQEAEVLLADDVRRFSRGVSKLVKVELTESQFCALVSFSFNVGISALANSTLLKYLNAGLYDAVPSQLKRWNKAGGKVLKGLVSRRQAEADLWLSVS